MPKKVLVTGVDGFTGRYLASLLATHGYQVHGLVNHPDTRVLLDVHAVYCCDLTDKDRVTEVVKHVQPYSVVHLAGVSFVGHGDIDAMYRINLLGTRNLLDALSQNFTLPRAVLLASSANVYGNGVEGVMDEATPPAPANDYAVSKLAMEYVARLYAGTLPIIVVRPFNYTGVGQQASFLVPKIVAHVLGGASEIELGNVDVARDFSDVRTVVDAYHRLLETEAALGRTFNVCSGKAHTLNEILTLAFKISGKTLNIRINPAFVRDNEVKILLGSKTNLENCIGPLNVIELRDTLRWMIKGHEAR